MEQIIEHLQIAKTLLNAVAFFVIARWMGKVDKRLSELEKKIK